MRVSLCMSKRKFVKITNSETEREFADVFV